MILRLLGRGIQCTPNCDRCERSYRVPDVNGGLGWWPFPFDVLSGSAGLGWRSIFRPFCSSVACGNGRNLPSCGSVANCDHYLIGGRAETVAIRRATTAWHFATKCLVRADWKWSEIARLQRRGISRPFFSGMAHKNGRDLPGCRTEANHDRFWVR